jgi:hypothetical protein
MRSEAGMVGEAVEPGAVETPPVERLVNLTEHVVMLVPKPQPATEGAAEAPLVCVPPDGRFARVDDGAARLHERLVDTESGIVRLTSLRRSGRLIDLPPPQAGIRYVVSRVTALAARDRGDLVFPFGEIRDEDGRVTGAQGLASFRPRAALWRRPWVWRAAARERRRGRPPGTQWLTGVFFAVATALLSGALSLFPGSLDEAKASGWGVAWASWTLRLTVVFAVAGAAVLIAAAWRWHERSAILEERGTAYVIEENAITWRHEEKASVLTDVGAGFAAVLRVPGPAELGSSWRWEADGDAAPQWDARLDELVSSFWAVHYNDDQITRNAVYVWAPWPVAMAFGARATARRRGLVLHVRQRPSYGAAGPHRRPRLTDEAHDFLRRDEPPSLAETAPLHAPVVVRETVTMAIKALATSDSGPHGRPAGHRGGQRPSGSAEGLLLLIVRVIHGPVGPIPLDLAHAPPFMIAVSPTLARSVIPTGSRVVPAVEWRLDPREAGVERVPDLPWAAFPAAAEAIADWIVEQAVAHSAHTVLLATRIPQELAVGLGVQLGQRSWERRAGQQWPQQVYPVFHTGTQLVVPDLRLGADSVPSQRPESS